MSLIQMSFTGTIMILAAVVIRALAINRLPKKVFVLLWEIILLRLLIPFSVPSALRRSVQIRQSDQISAPLTYGIVRPVVLMPKKTDWENGQQLQYILTHEYMHIRHFDMVWKLIAVAALCVHWFNPMVWLMYYIFNSDIELSCDESVVRQFGDNSRISYANTLITMEEKRSGLTPFCNNFSKSAIEKRIMAIMKTRKRTVRAVISGAVILVAVVILFATSAENRIASNSDGEIDVPGVVLDVAKQYVAGRFPGGNVAVSTLNSNDYSGWRIKSLVHAYTYDDLLGMTLQVYRLNYEFLAVDPESILLVGGMTIDEEGWVVPDYANSTYFIFQQNGEELSHLVTLFENDCSPGDEAFTIDLKRQLGLMEFEEERVSIEDYLIPEETSNGSRKELILELIQAMTSFYEAYFSRDKVAIMSHLVDHYPWGIEMYENSEHADEVDIKTIRGLNEIDGSSDQYTLSLEFVEPGEDSFTYLVVIFENENGEWKVNYYGLEK